MLPINSSTDVKSFRSSRLTDPQHSVNVLGLSKDASKFGVGQRARTPDKLQPVSCFCHALISSSFDISTTTASAHGTSPVISAFRGSQQGKGILAGAQL
jgi:hypothetical protein